MFILDDLLLWLPLKGITGVAQKIKEVAEEEYAQRKDLEELVRIRKDFREGLVTEMEFRRRLSKAVKKMKQRQ